MLRPSHNLDEADVPRSSEPVEGTHVDQNRANGGGAGAHGPPPPSAAILGRVIDALGMPQRLPFTGRGRRRSTDEVRGVDELTGGNVPLSVGERGIDDDPSGDEERRGDGRRRSVEELRDIDDLSLDEIAASLSIPLGTVKSRLHNAVRTLRDDPRTRKYFLE